MFSGKEKFMSILLSAAILSTSVVTGCAATKGNASAGDEGVKYEHQAYIRGFEDGTIRPDKTLTGAEAKQMLFNLGILDKAPDEEFQSSPVIPRGDFSDLLTDNVEGLKQSDIIQGYPGGDLGLERGLTRAEAATIINRALDRSADRMAMNFETDLRVMPDVTDSHWAYYELMEAVTSHNCEVQDGIETWTGHEPGYTGLKQGWRHIGGELFYVNEEGRFLYSTEQDGLMLDINGRYTTENAELDRLLTAEIKKIVNGSMTQEQKLRAVYDYMKEHYGYRGAGIVEIGAEGWDQQYAIDMFRAGKGNCYSWAAAFTYLARKVGYDAVSISGEAVSPKGSQRNHAWTEIEIDGKAYTFDPEIEGVFGKQNGENYDLFMKEYGTAVWKYVKPEKKPEENVPAQPGDVDKELSAILDASYDYESDQIPGMLEKIALTKENEKGFIGAEGLDYRAGIASESPITSVAHSVVILEMNSGADVEAAKKAIKENVDSYKWICVGVAPEKVLVESEGNYILLIIDENSSEFAERFHKHFR